MNELEAPLFLWDTHNEHIDHEYQLPPRSHFFVEDMSSRSVHVSGIPNVERRAQGSDDDTEVQMLLEEEDDDEQSFFSGTYNQDGDDWNPVNGDACHRKIRDCPSFYGDDEDEDISEEFSLHDDELSAASVRTPPVELQQDLLHSESTRKVTPEPTVLPVTLSAPDLTEVRRQVQRTWKKLAASMRRSEETGRLIKRRRQSEESDDSSCSMKDSFVASHCDIEATRRQVYEMIQWGVSS
jgi:hypothetical protein